MQDIVNETGLSKGAFYHYFESKEQLFLETLKYFFQMMKKDYNSYSKESLYQYYNDYINDRENSMRSYIEKSYGKQTNENSVTLNYFSLIFDMIKHFPEFRDILIKYQDEELFHWTKVVELARKNGEIDTLMTDREVGEIFFYLGDGAGIQQIIRGADVKGIVTLYKTLADRFYEQIKV